MKYYCGIIRRIERRKVRTRILVLFRFLFNDFFEDDKSRLVDWFCRLYLLGEGVGLFSVISLCAFFVYKIDNFVLSILLCGVLLFMFFSAGTNGRADETRGQMAFLTRFASQGEQLKWLLAQWNNGRNLLSLVLAAISMNLTHAIGENANVLFLPSSILLLLFFGFSSFAYFCYKLYINSVRKLFFFRLHDLSSLYRKDEKTSARMTSSNIVQTLLLRQTHPYKRLNLEKWTSLLLVLLFVISFSVRHFAKINILYIIVVLFVLFPVLLNSLCLMICGRCSSDASFVNTSYYLLKKHNIRELFVNKTFQYLVKKTRIHAAIWSFGTLLIAFDGKAAIFLGMSLLQWFSICYIVSAELHSYGKYDFDDLKEGFFPAVMQSPMVGFGIGLPMVFVSFLIYAAGMDLAVYLLVFWGYTLALLLTATGLALLLHRKNSQEEKNE